MSVRSKLNLQRNKRSVRVRAKLRKSELPRVSVFRSLKHMYAQVIGDATSTTLAHASTHTLENVSGDKKEFAKAVGLELAKQARAKGIERVSFDRGSYRYHGRVAALALGLREGGLEV